MKTRHIVLGLLSPFLLVYLLSLTQWMNMGKLKKYNPEKTKLMEYRKKQAQKKGWGYSVDHRYVPLSHISQYMVQAAVIAEDGNFYTHHGFEYPAIWESLKNNFKKGRVQSGASTISQQLAKNLFLYPKRSLWRKIQEAVLTWRMERTLTKNRIMELYLNSIEWGYGIYGVEAAARHYFGVSAGVLDIPQAAFLAALIQSPLTFNPENQSKYFRNRYQMIYAQMVGPVEKQAGSKDAPMAIDQAFKIHDQDLDKITGSDDEKVDLLPMLVTSNTGFRLKAQTVSANGLSK